VIRYFCPAAGNAMNSQWASISVEPFRILQIRSNSIRTSLADRALTIGVHAAIKQKMTGHRTDPGRGEPSLVPIGFVSLALPLPDGSGQLQSLPRVTSRSMHVRTGIRYFAEALVCRSV
jgi:hypothetical protein